MQKLLPVAVLAISIALPGAAWSQGAKKDCGPLPPSLSGVAFPGDGDTIYGVGWPAPVRLWGVQAPELRDAAKQETVPGMSARGLLADKMAAADHKTTCAPIEWDHYCRIVSTCTTGLGDDLTMDVLQAGLGYGFYLAKHPARLDLALSYAKAEAKARQERAGLWPTWLGEAKR